MYSWSKTTALIFALTSGSTAFAGHYDGPAVDVNFGVQKPAKYAECDKFLNDSSAKRYAACEFGRDEAERMAARFAAGNGRLDGYLRGFSWGLYKFTKAYQNDGASMAEGAKAVDGMGSYMEAGLAEGRRQGKETGNSRGRSDAIARFEAVVNTGKSPDSTVKIPETNYQGIDNAYTKYVGPVSTVEGIIKNDIDVGELPVYHDWDATYLGEVKPLSIWDLWFSDGTYVFEKARWYDKTLALDTWFKRPIDTRPKYDNLNQGAPVDPATGLPIDLQAVFQDAFRNSYEYYVNYYYSTEFHESLETGTMFGEQIGTQVGKRVATARGTEQAFNAKFKESSKLTFREAFEGAYGDMFNATFKDYSSNPKLSLTFDSIIGQDDDGIIQAGEAIAATFTIRNIGGVGSDLSASMRGSVVEASSQAFQIAKLQQKSFRTDFIAKIDPKLKPREKANVTLNVNGLTAQLSQLVQRMIEIKGTTPRIAVTEGNGSIQVLAENIATVRTPGMISATLKLNGAVVDSQNIGFIDAGATEDVVLEFRAVDPMTLIQGSLEAKVVVAMEGRTMDERTLTIKSDDSRKDLALYFNQLLGGGGFVPSGKDRTTRQAEVQDLIVRINEDETLSHKSMGNLWKKNPTETMIGKVVSQFHATAQSQDAKDQYERLAIQFWKARKNLPKFLFFKSGKRKAFEAMCEELTKDGKISRDEAK